MSTTSAEEIKTQIVLICQSLHQKGYLAAADGNVSYRLSDDEILITPSGVSKARMNTEQMAVVNLQGEVLSGRPSSERLMHLQVYRNCPEAKAVLHAHPPYSIAWSVARPDLKELPAEAMSELILAVGGVPFVPYARPSTQKMGDVLEPYLPEYRAMILSRHGALIWGENLEEVHNGIERVEHAAQVLSYAQQIGGITKLPEDEVSALKEMRQKIGSRIL